MLETLCFRVMALRYSNTDFMSIFFLKICIQISIFYAHSFENGNLCVAISL